MIRIERSACPDVIQDPADTGDRYSYPEVVARLAAMQHDKCCYCEKKIATTGHDRAVEHFRPKGILDRLEAAGLVVEVAQVGLHEGDEPDPVAHSAIVDSASCSSAKAGRWNPPVPSGGPPNPAQIIHNVGASPDGQARLDVEHGGSDR